MDTTLDVLIAAREEVSRGWCQHPNNTGGIGIDWSGKVCAVGAVERVTKRRGMNAAPARAALELCKPKTAANWCVSMWNDDPSTTKADVLALFDRAIAAEAVAATPDPSHVYTLA